MGHGSVQWYLLYWSVSLILGREVDSLRGWPILGGRRTAWAFLWGETEGTPGVRGGLAPPGEGVGGRTLCFMC